MGKKALLMILDGWGIGNGTKSDVIAQMPTPYWDSLLAKYPHSQLQASGEYVGLVRRCRVSSYDLLSSLRICCIAAFRRLISAVSPSPIVAYISFNNLWINHVWPSKASYIR